MSVTGLPSARSFSAKASPSSLSGSYSAVAIHAGATPRKSGAPRSPSSGAKRQSSPIAAISHVVLEEPLDRVARQQEAVGEARVRVGLLMAGRARINQQLQREHEAGVAREHRANRRECAARAIAAHREPRAVDAEFGRVRVQPAEGVEGIVDSGRKLVLGREPVIDRQHRALAVAREHPAQRIVRIDAANRKAAAVVVHERRQRLGPARLDRTVQARADRRAVARRHAQIFDGEHRRARDLEDRRAFLVRRARRLRAHLVVLRAFGPRDHVEHLLDRGIQRHGFGNAVRVAHRAARSAPRVDKSRRTGRAAGRYCALFTSGFSDIGSDGSRNCSISS
ncbi:hypothetical protein OKW29_005096 [Paraburkholderia sp. CI3]